MQTTRIFFGPVENSEYSRTIDQMLNDALAEMPDMRLVQTTVINTSENFCTLLCVFDTEVK